MDIQLHLLLIGLCIIFLIWSYTDPRPFKERFTFKMLEIYLLLYFIIAPQIISYYFISLPKGKLDPYILISGVVFFISGLMIDIWSRLTMNIYWGPPGQHDSKRQTKLITQGPYKYSRNPIYVGTLLLTLGFSLTLRSIFFMLPFLLFLYFIKQTEKEEKLLYTIFGKEYERYKKITPRFFPGM